MKKNLKISFKNQSFNGRSLRDIFESYKVYLISIFVLLLSCLLLFNLSPASLLTNENNLQPMPAVSVDLTGKANISYQIETPEGTKGMDPNFSANYNSAGGYGNMGAGWSLSGFEWITRDTAYGVDYSANDQFATTLAGSLVKGADGNYYSRKETFMKFVPVGGEAHTAVTWFAYDKSGNKYTFASNRSIHGVTAVWALTKVEDIYGNGYTVSYSGDTITFEYADRKVVVTFKTISNPIIKYSNNSVIPDNSIVDKIKITAGSNLTRLYTFTYNLDTNGQEIISKIDKSETINGGNIEYTSISYSYSSTTVPKFTSTGEYSNPDSYARVQIHLNDKSFCIQGERDCLEYSLTTCATELSNVNTTAATAVAACSTGILCSEATAAATAAQVVYSRCLEKQADLNQKCNQYQATWFIPCMGGMSSPVAIQTPVDINGDGKQEIAVLNGATQSGTIHIEKMEMQNGAIAQSSVSNNFPGFHYKAVQTSGFGDVNGDGKTDFVYSDGSVLRVAFSNGSSFSDPVAQANVSVPLAPVNFRFDMPEMKWRGSLIDINGDGRADYVKVKDGANLGVHLSQGNSFGNEITAYVGNVFRDVGEGEQPGQFLDIDGDGIPEYVFIEANQITASYFNSSFNGIQETKSYPISGGTENARNRWITDLNRDGKLDFITLNTNLDYTPHLFDGKNFNRQSTFTILNSTYSTKENPLNKYFVDVNGDGFADILHHSSDGMIRVSFGKGLSFNESTSPPNPAKHLWSIADLNGDGYLDIISLKETQGSAITGLTPSLQNFGNAIQSLDKAVGSMGGNSSITTGIVNVIFERFLPPAAGYWLGLLQLLETATMSYESKMEVFLQNERGRENQITLIDGGFGREVNIEYIHGKKYVTETSLGNIQYPVIVYSQVGEVVKSIRTKMSNLMDNTDTYSYSNPRVWLGKSEDAAMLGFKTKTVKSSLTGVSQTEEYNHSSNLFAGAVVSSITKNGAEETKKTSSAEYKVLSPFGRPYPVLKSNSETVYQDGTPLLTVTQDLSANNCYDSYGNILNKTTSSAGSTTIETASYEYDTANWILNRPLQTKKEIDGMTVENTTYSYSGNSEIRVTRMAETVGAATSTITLDSHGNPVAVQDQVPERRTTYQYDSVVHNYVTNVTNPAGFSIVKTYDTSLGLELTVTDANGAVMRKEYDKKGRVIKIIPPGSDSYVERYIYTDYEAGNASGYFTSVAKAVVNADGTEAVATEYFDLLGRTIRKESPGVQGKFIVETTEYDSKGQVSRKSNPYLETLETPVYTTYTYHPHDGYVIKVVNPDGSYSVPTFTGFNEKIEIYGTSGTLISTVELIKNAKGQVLTRTVDGKSIKYQYDAAGRITKILDPENGATTTIYDNAGRRISVSDPNSGTTVYTYDQFGSIKTQKDARNITTTFTYDNLNRPIEISYNPVDTLEPLVTGGTTTGNTILKYDEGGKDKYANGRLTSVMDVAGKLELGYDIRGNRIYQKRDIDEYHVIFRRTYDIQNRLESTTYPDGTKVYQKYASTGHFSGITMDTFDGSSRGYTVGSYMGPIIENGIFKIIRETGNGVRQEIEYDPIKRRPVGLFTKLEGVHVVNQKAYSYDEKDNMTKIEDKLDAGRTQEYVYDAQNRLAQAKGKYGIENYTYSDNGNLTRRGNFTLTYGDANHKHAVTSVTSPNTGALDYSYDAAGNMISRVGDVMSYNAQGKLRQIDTVGGDKIEYVYDSAGNRILKKSKNSGVITYSFDGLYEITKTPSQGTTHTLYFKGLYGDIFSQMTRSDAELLADAKPIHFLEHLKSAGILSFMKGDVLRSSFCSEVAVSCSQYYLNTARHYWTKGIIAVYTVVSRVEYDIFVWMLLVVALYGIYAQYIRRYTACRVSTTTNEKPWFAKRTLFVTPLLTISILFTFTQCGVIGGKKNGTAPWLLLASGINQNTPSVADGGYTPYGGNNVNGGGGSNSSLVPVIGMYFLHPDHLGSITMITDGKGNIVTDNTGKSNISYKPYGEIHRTDSSGPDISKFKYTGQEEDVESGLMYYKARYYDPVIGRFLQADSIIMPESTFGMNRYMYVEGNPVRFGDDSGNVPSKMWVGIAINYFLAKEYGFVLAKGNIAKNISKGAEWGAKGASGAPKWAIDPKGGAGLALNVYLQKEYGIVLLTGDTLKWATKGATGGLKWMSKGLQNAADYANLLAGKRHHKNGDNDFDRSDLGRSDWGRSDEGQFYSKGFDMAARNQTCVVNAVKAVVGQVTGLSAAVQAEAATLSSPVIAEYAGYLLIAYSIYECARTAKRI